MHASTLKDAAGTVTETVGDLARSVAEITPDVTGKAGDVASKVGDTALKLAALTPWVEEATRSRSMRRWILAIGAVVAVLGVIGWWQKKRRPNGIGTAGTANTPSDAERHLRAAAGS